MNLQELPRLKDSISYLYIEHAIVERDANSLIAIRQDGKIPIPIAAVTCLLLGPGTKITHAAIRVICDSGCMAVWCGEGIGRFYAAGVGETRSAKNLLWQAKNCMDEELHMQVVRRMYDIRFPHVDTAGMTLQQIRGMEGIRVRKAYDLAARRTGIKWNKRHYKRDEWEKADPINRALSTANALLYGVVHAAVVSLGYSPGLGFVHTGKQLSFVYDIADLYKAETTIPAAFEAVKKVGASNQLDREVRINCRKYFSAIGLLERIAEDIATVLQTDQAEEHVNDDKAGDIWDEDGALLCGGINYSEMRDDE